MENKLAYDEECDLIKPETLKMFIKKELGAPYKSFHVDTNTLYGEHDYFIYKNNNCKEFSFVLPTKKR